MARDPNPVTAPTPLQAIVVGAGIGGLAAAVALRRKGHKVTVYERSQWKVERGQAIQMAPNATAALQSLGIDVDAWKPVQLHTSSVWDQGKVHSRVDMLKQAPRWPTKWMLYHRVDLHNSLKDAALNPKGLGPVVDLRLGAKVKAVEPELGMVEFEDGTAAFADVIIGADGVNSITRSLISNNKPFESGKSAYRFTIPRETLQKHPEIGEFQNFENDLKIMQSSDRSIVIYPARDNELLSIAVVHPDVESDGTSVEQIRSGDKATMIKVAEKFGPMTKALLELAIPDEVKIWKVYDMEFLDSWTKGRLALMGDAAHPLLPYQAQGGAQAVEDGVTIGEVFPMGTGRHEVADRLKLYQSIRKPRAEAITEHGRFNGRDNENYMEKMELGVKNRYWTWLHNEYEHSRHIVRQYLAENSNRAVFGIPTAFGPGPSPRQNSRGEAQITRGSGRTISVQFKSSRHFLENFFPNSSFAFVNQTDVVMPATLLVQDLSNLSWLGGMGYKTLGLHLPGVEYTSSDGSKVRGTFPVAIFEDLPEAVVSDREELGFPAFFADIDTARSADRHTISVRVSWKGTTFLSLEVENLQRSAELSVPKIYGDNALTWRYLPATGAKAIAESEHAICIPPSPMISTDSLSSTEATVEWKAHSPTKLPTLHHVLERLTELPVYEVISASVTDHATVPTNDGAYPL